jgi:hypothetical protein
MKAWYWYIFLKDNNNILLSLRIVDHIKKDGHITNYWNKLPSSVDREIVISTEI